MYQERMLGYYPNVIRKIQEFQAIIGAEAPEFQTQFEDRQFVLDQAFLSTMGEDRVSEWEKILNIRPVADSTIGDRRDTIIARLRGQGKLNSSLISNIVNAFTGGTANAFVSDGVLHVEITPPKDNKSYIFANVEQELSKKTPAHLGLSVTRKYSHWQEIYDNFTSWNDIKTSLDDWNDVNIYLVETS